MNISRLRLRVHPQRLIIAVLIGILAALFSRQYRASSEGLFVDLGWAFNAAQDLVAGLDTYRHIPSAILIPYPLTAAIVVFPFAMLPANIGMTLWFGTVCSLLAYGLMREGKYWRLMVFVTPAFWNTALTVQWSPLFMAVLLYPALLPVLSAKPTLAIPVALSTRWTLRRLLGAALIVLVSLIIMPDWPWRWLSQLGSYGGFIPLFTLFGPLLALTLLFWRNWQARFLFLLSVTPQHRMFYDQLLVWMIPQTALQMALLTASAWVGFRYVHPNYATPWPAIPSIMLSVYLPALLLVLWQQRATVIAFFARQRHVRAQSKEPQGF